MCVCVCLCVCVYGVCACARIYLRLDMHNYMSIYVCIYVGFIYEGVYVTL